MGWRRVRAVRLTPHSVRRSPDDLSETTFPAHWDGTQWSTTLGEYGTGYVSVERDGAGEPATVGHLVRIAGTGAAGNAGHAAGGPGRCTGI